LITTQDRVGRLSPQKRALFEALRSRARQGDSASEPIAVVGLACRLPGGTDDEEAFWDLLRDARCAIGRLPEGRWSPADEASVPPDSPARFGGFLRTVAEFEPEFFSMSRRECERVDPQQRLVLEVAWEALESAGVVPGAPATSRTGVFLGVSNADYEKRMLASGASLDLHLGMGSSFAALAGRVAHALGLQGPVLSLDTLCSSSLVAVHLAIQSLRGGECDLALAGGVNLILSPDTSLVLERAGALAADGRCKSFAKEADGFGRGEGCGVVALRRLSDALAQRERIRALLLGSALNHDGRSGGFTVPNGRAQQDVIRRALAAADVRPDEIQVVEAQGTGTQIGDAIEARAIRGVFCDGRGPDRPLLMGSVKTNLGHLEPAAGVAALIKTILSLERGILPAHVSGTAPPSHPDLDGAPVEFPQRATSWPDRGPRRLASVHAYSMSGSNAHLVVSSAPPSPAREAVGAGAHLLVASGRTPAGLAARLAQLRNWLEGPGAGERLDDLACTLGSRRRQHAARAAIVAETMEEAVAGLSAALARVPSRTWRRRRSGRVVFAFFDGVDAGDATDVDPRERTTKAILDAAARLAEAQEAGPTEVRIDRARLLQFAAGQSLREWGIEPWLVLGSGPGRRVAHAVASGLEAALASRPGWEVEPVEPIGFSPGGEGAGFTQGDARCLDAEATPLCHAIASVLGGGVEGLVCFGASPSERMVIEGLSRAAAPGDVWVEHVSWAAPGESPLEVAARLFERGHDLAWERLVPDGCPIGLPPHPWQRRRYWIDESPADGQGAAPRRSRGSSPPEDAPLTPTTSPGLWARILACAPGTDRLKVLEDEIHVRIAGILRIGPEEFDAEDDLVGLGFDSLAAVEARDWLERELELELDLPSFVETSCVRELAHGLARRLGLERRPGDDLPDDDAEELVL